MRNGDAFIIGFGAIALALLWGRANAGTAPAAAWSSDEWITGTWIPEPGTFAPAQSGGGGGGGGGDYYGDPWIGFDVPVYTVEPGIIEPVMRPPSEWNDTAVEFHTDAPVPTWSYPPEGEPYRPLIEQTERENGLPPLLLARLLAKESSFNPNAVNLTSGAQGIAQFMPATARDIGLTNPFDPNQAIPAAGRYLAWLRSQVSGWIEALAAYNWGIGNVLRFGLSRMPAETRNYVRIADDVGVI